MSTYIVIIIGGIIGGGLGKLIYFPSPTRPEPLLPLYVAFLALCFGVMASRMNLFWTNWLAFLAFLSAALLVIRWGEKQFDAADARRLERKRATDALRLELEELERICDFGAEGARLYEQAEASVAEIAGSEAARAGWLGDPSDFDFRADLTAIADNLRRAEEIRKARGEGASITHLTAADKKMLRDAQRAIAALEKAAEERSRLIGECDRQTIYIDAQLADDRERGVMAKRREDMRNRLGTVLYGTQNIPAEIPSESADVVKARAAAFHELRGVLRNYRLDGGGVQARGGAL